MSMTRNRKRICTFALCALFALFTALAFVFMPLRATKVKAAVSTTKVMYDGGASIRLNNDIQDDNGNDIGSGIRMRICVTADKDGSVDFGDETYTQEEFEDLTKGILVIPADKLESDEELTIEGTTTPYKRGARAANPPDLVWSLQTETDENGTVTYYYQSSAYVYNIPENSYDREFAYRGYYVNANGEYVYSDTYTRSVSYVAFQEKVNDVKVKEEDASKGHQGEILNTLNGYLPVRLSPSVNFVNREKYIYRVGNQNEVAFSSLFTASQTEEVPLQNLTVTSETVEGSATVTFNTSTQKLTFDGEGIVKLTATEDFSRAGAELILEVVNAYNATSAVSATEKDVVLLNDISAGSITISDGYTLYGNGFKISFEGYNGSYAAAAVSYGFVTIKNGGVLDNAQIICDIFPESYMYTAEMTAGSDGKYPYGYSAIVISGNSTISNSYIYGARNNIQVGEGNVTIENTITECGSLSNIHIKSNDAYTVTLKDVTTIQYVTTSNYDTSKNVLGFGVLVGTSESVSNPTLKLEGVLAQYNWVTEDMNVSNSYANTAITNALKVTTYQHTNKDGKTTVNMGIVYLNELEANITDERSDKTSTPYVLNTIAMGTYKGQVYSVTGGTVPTENKVGYESTGNKDVMPTVSFAGANDTSIICAPEYDTVNGWKYILKLDLDNISGGSYNVAFNDVSVKKYGVDLAYTIKDSSGSTISSTATINEPTTLSYTLVVTDNLIYGADGNSTGESRTVEIPFEIKSTKTSIDPPEFANAGTATAIRLVSSAGGDWRPAYTVLTGVSVEYWSASEGAVKTVDLSTLYNSGTISANVWTYTCDDYTLTITGGAVHSDDSKITPVVANSTLYFASTNKAFTTGTTSRNIVLTYVFTDKNASTTWDRTETVTYSELSEYDYNSFKNNGTLTAPSSSSDNCVTPDTLITLADGTQVRVDSLTGSEQLLVWNMETGALDSAPIMFVDSDPVAVMDIVHLYFADGTDVKVIGEHGFWDYDLNKYVYLDENAAQYIGHTFAKQNGDSLEKVQLVDVVIETEMTTAWSPVTEKHLCYFVNGMLSMPGGVGGLFNIFDVDADTMTYDYASIERDIELYGLFTYEELNAIVELPENMFNEAGGMYLKISIAKGNMTMEELIAMINRYKHFYA